LTFWAEKWNSDCTPALERPSLKLGFLRLSVFELASRTGQTDRQTDGRAERLMRPVRAAAH